MANILEKELVDPLGLEDEMHVGIPHHDAV